MKIIITENQTKFIRRYREIEEKIYRYLLGRTIYRIDSFDNFLTELAWDVSSDIVRKMNIPEEEYVMVRNQFIQFIKTNFYQELKEYWERNR